MYVEYVFERNETHGIRHHMGDVHYSNLQLSAHDDWNISL